MADAEDRGRSAADLLASWRSAERDLTGARQSASVADLARTAANQAVAAARETGEAARLSSVAAQHAERSAYRTAEAAEITAGAATKDLAETAEAVRILVDAESEAGANFRDAQRLGFPKAPPADEEPRA